MPYDNIIFYDYGSAASTNLPAFIDDADAPASWWNQTDPTQTCEQTQFRDFTGVDSLSAFLCSILVFAGVQALENWLGRPLFNFPGLEPYRKDLGGDDHSVDKAVEAEKGVALEETHGEDNTNDSPEYSAGVAKELDSSEEEGMPEPTVEETPASTKAAPVEDEEFAA